jgi:O-antigen/teichoic acid export membrane protein
MKDHPIAARSAGLSFDEQIFGSDFLRKVGETFATRIGLLLIGLMISIAVTRILGPEGRGRYAVAAALSSLIIQFGNFGLHTSNTYSVARDPKLLGPLLGNALTLSCVVGAASALLAELILTFWPSLVEIRGALLTLTLLSVPLGLGQMLTHNLLVGLHELRAYNKLELAASIITAALIGCIILLRLVTVETVFLTGLAGTGISFLWSVLRLRALLTTPIRISPALFSQNLRYGMKAYLVCLFGFVLLRIDVFMVQYILGEAQTGYYSVATALADLLYLLPSVIGMVLFPKLSANPVRSERWRLTRRVTFTVVAFMITFSVLAALFSRLVIRLVLGEVFLPAAAPFVVLSVAMVFYGGNTPVSNYLASEGFPAIAIYVWVVAAIVNIGLNVVLIPAYGIQGAAAASLVGYGIVFFIQYVYAVRTAKPVSATT